MAGTDWYMAPEVAKKMKYGKSVDTYSLGLVLYWLLNDGRLPFVPEKDRISTKDMQAAYRLRMQGKEIPEPKRGSRQLKAVVLKALSFEREKRYRSGKEMLEALLEIEKLTKAENARAQRVQTQKRQNQNVQVQNGQDQKTQGQEERQHKSRRKHRRRTFHKNRKCKEDRSRRIRLRQRKMHGELHMRRIFCDSRNGTDVQIFSYRLTVCLAFTWIRI